MPWATSRRFPESLETGNHSSLGFTGSSQHAVYTTQILLRVSFILARDEVQH